MARRPRSDRLLPAASTVARVLYGTALVTRPGPFVAAVSGDHADGALESATRLLGARHLVQAAVFHAGPGRREAGAVVDAIHALTALVWAAASPRHRRLALADAGLATGWAADGALAARAARGR